MKVVAKCVQMAKKAVKTGAFPVVTGRLDERFVPSSQVEPIDSSREAKTPILLDAMVVKSICAACAPIHR